MLRKAWLENSAPGTLLKFPASCSKLYQLSHPSQPLALHSRSQGATQQRLGEHRKQRGGGRAPSFESSTPNNTLLGRTTATSHNMRCTCGSGPCLHVFPAVRAIQGQQLPDRQPCSHGKTAVGRMPIQCTPCAQSLNNMSTRKPLRSLHLGSFTTQLHDTVSQSTQPFKPSFERITKYTEPGTQRCETKY